MIYILVLSKCKLHTCNSNTRDNDLVIAALFITEHIYNAPNLSKSFFL